MTQEKNEVVATKTLSEKHFMGKKVWVHARRGDRGSIVDVSDDLQVVTVRFHRSGTVTDVYMPDEAVFCK